MNGRYHVLPNGTADLNTNTISGVELPENNYPLVGCLTPISIVDPSFTQAQWEKFSFRLLFLCTSINTGDNQLKGRDHLTNTGLHSIPKDWSDMKSVSFSFLKALEEVSKKIRQQFHIDDRTPVRINRITSIENHRLSGVIVTFNGMLATKCEYTDISAQAVSEIVIPTFEHTEHKH